MESKLASDLIAAGAHFGYSKTRRHPSTKEYIFATKNNVDIIDISRTERQLDAALAFVKTLGEEKKTILFVSGKPESKKIMEVAARSLNMPYVENRWIGGTLTNFPQIKKRIDVLIDLKMKKEKGELAKYTKKEQSDFARQIEKMEKNFGGLVGMTRKPDAVFIIDTKKERTWSRSQRSALPTPTAISVISITLSLVMMPPKQAYNSSSTKSLKRTADKLWYNRVSLAFKHIHYVYN
jgi:ribosomal protein S2